MGVPHVGTHIRISALYLPTHQLFCRFLVKPDVLLRAPHNHTAVRIREIFLRGPLGGRGHRSYVEASTTTIISNSQWKDLLEKLERAPGYCSHIVMLSGYVPCPGCDCVSSRPMVCGTLWPTADLHWQAFCLLPGSFCVFWREWLTPCGRVVPQLSRTQINPSCWHGCFFFFFLCVRGLIKLIFFFVFIKKREKGMC